VKSFKQLKKGEENDKQTPEEARESKIYLLNRKKTDKRIYKPLKKYIF